MDWLDLLAVQGTLKNLLQHHSSKASILWCSAFFVVQFSHPYTTTGKTIALTRQTFVGKVMSLCFLFIYLFIYLFFNGKDVNENQREKPVGAKSEETRCLLPESSPREISGDALHSPSNKLQHGAWHAGHQRSSQETRAQGVHRGWSQP